jgi:hypothetical protein
MSKELQNALEDVQLAAAAAQIHLSARRRTATQDITHLMRQLRAITLLLHTTVTDG